MTNDRPVVWLASFPKSGNTWVRAIITAACGGERIFTADKLSSGSQPHYVGAATRAFGLDPRWLDVGELRTVRDSLVALSHDGLADLARSPAAAGDGDDQPIQAPSPIFRKTHEVYRRGSPGAEAFPTRASLAAILIVRDPRAVACSWAPFFGVGLADAVTRINQGQLSKASPTRAQTEQPWGTWASHARSWLDPTLPFPVHVVRYEDLRADAVGTLHPVFNALGWDVSETELATAAARTEFDWLQSDEREQGFRESSFKTKSFFRRGQTSTWVSELSRDQMMQIESANAEVMAD
jgi:aryl sulfotransferase